MGSIPGGSSAGGTNGTVLHLPDALQMYPECGIEFYNRNSSWGQAGKGKTKLHEKTYAAVDEVRKLAPLKLRRIVQGVEEGKLSKPRPKLRDAVGYAKKRGLMIVTIDLSRLIRPESYCRQTNPEAWPTHEEFDQLSEMASGVILATLEDPMLTESERHSLATKRTGTCGRPRSIDAHLAKKIFAALDYLVFDRSFRWRWGTPLAKVARRFGVTPAAIVRTSQTLSPNGQTWRNVAIGRAAARGFLEIRENGDIVSLLY